MSDLQDSQGESGGQDRPRKCDSCGMSLVSFSNEKLAGEKCPICLDPHTTENGGDA